MWVEFHQQSSIHSRLWCSGIVLLMDIFLDTPANNWNQISLRPPWQKQNHNEENRSSTGTSVLDQQQSPVDDANLCSKSAVCVAPVCRQFWKVVADSDDVTLKSTTKLGSSYLHIHPKFLHSNATSHKWVFGVEGRLAMAELMLEATLQYQTGQHKPLPSPRSRCREVMPLSPKILLESDQYTCEICNQRLQRDQNP